MRIPGTRKLTAAVVRSFELTASDIRVIRRGYKATKATVAGAAVGAYAESGNPFADPKAFAVTVGTTALAMAIQKRQSEKQTEALYSQPPNGGDPK